MMHDAVTHSSTDESAQILAIDNHSSHHTSCFVRFVDVSIYAVLAVSPGNHCSLIDEASCYE
jgi:hypothetical protein